MLLDVTATIHLYIDLLYCILHPVLTHGLLGGKKKIKKINNSATQATSTKRTCDGTSFYRHNMESAKFFPWYLVHHMISIILTMDFL